MNKESKLALGQRKIARHSEHHASTPAPPTIVKPVDNAIRILRYLSLIGKPSTVTLVARELKINPSTCFNILRTLAWTGVLEFDASTKTYVTGLGAVDLANRALLRGTTVISQMQPQLERLARTYAITVSVWRRIGEDRIMLTALFDHAAAVRIHLRLGQRIPLLAGAGGRVMAAFGGLEDDDVEKRVQQIQWNRPPNLRQYMSEVRTARKNHWAVDDGNYVSGLWSVAAPIFNEDGVLRGHVAATMLKGQHDKRVTQKIVAEIKQMGDAFTRPELLVNHP